MQQDTPLDYSAVSQNESTAVKYAGFFIRWVANFVDILILFIISILVLFGLLVVFPEGTYISFIFPSLVFVISAGYFIVLTYGMGATIGKRILGLKVISSKGEKLSFRQVVLRETLGKIASGLILGIGYIMAGFTEKKEALHDKIAKTNVIYKNPNKKNNILNIIPIFLFVFAMVMFVLFFIMFTTHDNSYQF